MELQGERKDENDIGWTDADWRKHAELTGCTDMQVKFVRARVAGASQVKAAEVAGYAGDYDQLRSVGHRVARSASVQSLHELAVAGGAGIPDSILTGEESKRILSRIARGGDKSIAIRAAEVLHRIDRDEREVRDKLPTDSRALLDEIAHIDPVYAARLATREGITDWSPDWLDSLPKCPQCGQIIRLDDEEVRLPANGTAEPNRKLTSEITDVDDAPNTKSASHFQHVEEASA